MAKSVKKTVATPSAKKPIAKTTTAKKTTPIPTSKDTKTETKTPGVKKTVAKPVAKTTSPKAAAKSTAPKEKVEKIAKPKVDDNLGEFKMPKSIKRILISQPEPVGERSPYHEVSKRNNFKVDFTPFLNVESITLREFRKFKINIPEYTAVIFNSKNAIDYFFKICEEIRHKMPQDAKYFCSSEQIAFYLQKYIQYRKRKVVYANGTTADLQTILMKHKVNEKFLMPCSTTGVGQLASFLKTNKFDFSEAIMFRMVPNENLKKKNFDYDIVTFFNTEGVKAFFSVFPTFKQGRTLIGGFGEPTQKALEEHGVNVLIKAPIGEIKSMVMAVDKLFKDYPNLKQ